MAIKINSIGVMATIVIIVLFAVKMETFGTQASFGDPCGSCAMNANCDSGYTCISVNYEIECSSVAGGGCNDGICVQNGNDVNSCFVQDSCEDSDGGQDRYTYGEVTEVIDGEPLILQDYCITGDEVIEHYCSGNVASFEYLSCFAGCSGGKCAQPICSDSDGTNYKNKGYVDVNQGRFYDVCDSSDSDILYERSCSGSEYEVITKDCTDFGSDYGCSDGACVQRIECQSPNYCWYEEDGTCDLQNDVRLEEAYFCASGYCCAALTEVDCIESSDCEVGEICMNNECKIDSNRCISDSDCGQDEECNSQGNCVSGTGGGTTPPPTGPTCENFWEDPKNNCEFYQFLLWVLAAVGLLIVLKVIRR